MIEVKAGNAGNSSGGLLHNIAKFSRAAAACAPCLRPAGEAEIDYFWTQIGRSCFG